MTEEVMAEEAKKSTRKSKSVGEKDTAKPVLKQTASMSGYNVYSQGGSSAFNGRFRTYGLRVDS